MRRLLAPLAALVLLVMTACSPATETKETSPPIDMTSSAIQGLTAFLRGNFCSEGTSSITVEAGSASSSSLDAATVKELASAGFLKTTEEIVKTDGTYRSREYWYASCLGVEFIGGQLSMVVIKPGNELPQGLRCYPPANQRVTPTQGLNILWSSANQVPALVPSPHPDPATELVYNGVKANKTIDEVVEVTCTSGYEGGM